MPLDLLAVIYHVANNNTNHYHLQHGKSLNFPLFSLNAWFERSRPYLELRNNHTNKVVIRLYGERLHEVLQDIGYDYGDLLRNGASSELIKSLLLAAINDYPVKIDPRHELENKVTPFPKIKKAEHAYFNSSNVEHYENVIYIDRILLNSNVRKA